MSKHVAEYEIIDHGIENSSYFQGCGVAFTEFTDVATGIGCDFAEAFEDALDSLEQGDWETESIKPGKHSKRRVTSKHGDECYYHVSIRVKE